MQLFIVRHGDPDYPNNTITSAGHLEAAALAQRMATQIRPDLLYSSPLGRARHTMAPTEKALGLTGKILDWTAELHLFGKEEGPWGAPLAYWDLPGHWIRNAPQGLPTHSNWHLHPPFDDPEITRTFDHIRTESDKFLATHGYERKGGRYACVAPHRQKIAVFCHGGLGLTWLAHLLEIPLTLMWSGFWLPPSSVTTILFDEREHAWSTPRCIGMGDISHLYAAGLTRSNIGLKANRE